MNLLREYVRELLVEQGVKFSGILKIMPSPEIVTQAEKIVATLPRNTQTSWEGLKPVIPLPADKFHVTLVHQSLLKPFKKQLKALDKTGQLPPPPMIQLDPQWEERTDEALQRKSYVAWIVNQDEVATYLNKVMELIDGPANIWTQESPVRRFHVSLANLTGNPGDSVR